MKLRISINAKRIEGPYGGGNQVANALERYLRSRGHEVFRETVPNLDVILILSAQAELYITSYDVQAIADYLMSDANTIVVQRVNTCDEQRGANSGINRAVLQANRLADYTVFVSSFVKELYQKHGFDATKPHCVILNGADEDIFNSSGRAEWQNGQKLRIVTHHWSTNYMKGFDIYERLDQLMGKAPYKDVFEFTYIGNIPVGVEFQNSRLIPPLYGIKLAQALKQHHFYVTAARHEPGGNHPIEAMRCGLPVLYLRSGSLPEYCSPYGIEFTLVDFEKRLFEMRERYPEFRQNVLQCSYTGSGMASQYEALFKRLVAERRANPRARPSLKKALWYAARSSFRKGRRYAKRAVREIALLR